MPRQVLQGKHAHEVCAMYIRANIKAQLINY
jgi:hypothetical protein